MSGYEEVEHSEITFTNDQLNSDNDLNGRFDESGDGYSASVEVPDASSNPGKFSWRKLWAFMGPGFLVSIAYIDPGNFETDLQAGAQFRYQLIWVLLVATMLGLLLQYLAARLGIITGKDLAQMCHTEYPRYVRYVLWILAETTVIASDIPEVLGTAIALKLLFGLRLWVGTLVTSVSVLVFLAVSYFGIRKLEAMIGFMIAVMFICFEIEFFKSSAKFVDVVSGFVPRVPKGSLVLVASLTGAVVMPHNLFLHSALVKTRKIQRNTAALKEACFYNLVESAIALLVSLFINISVLSLAAAEFADTNPDAGLLDAPHLLKSLLGGVAPTLFAIALLASGQSSTMTGTYAGQFVMEGFIQLKIPRWLRALITRSVAIVPSFVIAVIAGESGADSLIVFSQGLLAMLLPFSLIPLVKFSASRDKMGQHQNSFKINVVATGLGTLLTVGNIATVWVTFNDTVLDKLSETPFILACIGIGVLGLTYVAFLAYLLFKPIRPSRRDSLSSVDLNLNDFDSETSSSYVGPSLSGVHMTPTKAPDDSPPIRMSTFTSSLRKDGRDKDSQKKHLLSPESDQLESRGAFSSDRNSLQFEHDNEISNIANGSSDHESPRSNMNNGFSDTDAHADGDHDDGGSSSSAAEVDVVSRDVAASSST